MSTIHVPSVIEKGVEFTVQDWRGMVVIPQNIVVRGELNIINCQNVSPFYDETYIIGDLNLQNSNIKRLPKHFIIGGDLILANTWCEEKPEVVVVCGNLFVKQCTWFKKKKKSPKFIVRGHTYIGSD